MRSFSLYSIQSLARSVAPPLKSSFNQGITLHDITSSFFSFLLSYVPCSSRLHEIISPFLSVPFLSFPFHSYLFHSNPLTFDSIPLRSFLFLSFPFLSFPFYSIPSLPFLSLSLIPVIFLRALNPSQTI